LLIAPARSFGSKQRGAEAAVATSVVQFWGRIPLAVKEPLSAMPVEKRSASIG
jgi:hypothetical protein